MAGRKARKKKKKSVKPRAGKIAMLRLPDGRTYIAPLSALGRPVRNAKLNKVIDALKEKTGEYYHWCDFAGAFPVTTFTANFGNGHLPPH